VERSLKIGSRFVVNACIDGLHHFTPRPVRTFALRRLNANYIMILLESKTHRGNGPVGTLFRMAAHYQYSERIKLTNKIPIWRRRTILSESAPVSGGDMDANMIIREIVMFFNDSVFTMSPPGVKRLGC
jgi:hypothetical protein